MTRPYDDIETMSDDEIEAMHDGIPPVDSEADYNGGDDDPPTQPRLKRLDLAKWDKQAPPERKWTVFNRFLRDHVSLLSGEGGVGKDILLQQLAGAHALGRDWLGSMPESGRVLIVSCEEDEDEIARRWHPILDHYEASYAEIDRRIDIFSLAGEDAILGYPDNGRMIPTPLYFELKDHAVDFQPVNIMISNAADVFGGDEINRGQVRQFVMLLRRLAIAADSGVLLSAHPSVSGLSSKTGLSGSTQWHNGPRGRAWFKHAITEGGSEIDADLRELEFKKNQYGPKSETIMLRWKRGLFVPEPRLGSLEQLGRDKEVDELFLSLLAKLSEQGQNVSPSRSSTYAPKIFSEQPEARGNSIDKFAKAMQRLLDAGKIKIETFGSPSKQRQRLTVP